MAAFVTAVANEKGGVGKTSVCLELATALTIHGNAKVLALDADPQHGLIDWRADRERTPLFPVVGFASEKLNAEVRAHVANYDHILIDAPPRHMAILRAIILSAHCLLIPVTPSKHDLRSTQNFLETVKEAIAFNPDLKVAFIVNRSITGTALSRDIFTALEEYPFPVLHTVIGQRVAFPEAHAAGLSVLEEKHSGHSPAVAEIESLALELLEMLNHDEKDSPSKEAVRIA